MKVYIPQMECRESTLRTTKRPGPASQPAPALCLKIVSDQLDTIDLDALHALTGGIANALLRRKDRNPRTAQGAGMEVDVPASILRHHKAEALLVVEELHGAFDHRAA